MTTKPIKNTFNPEDLPPEQTLDPKDWQAFRNLAHRALDEAIDYVQNVRERPPWKPVPEAAKKALTGPVPKKGKAVEKVYEEFRENILPYPLGNIHPRHWG